MLPFQDAAPTPAGDWRHIVRFGRNVASYKFALGRVLLDLATQQHTFVRMEDLYVLPPGCAVLPSPASAPR